ncbi:MULTISPECIES: hypothetical protein [Pectobacterium]|uniref:hypothetical protein n=1 Tax=Pectobacterium TaxID=122277 RepID=UPI0015F12020|nr:MULTISPECIES: hypothetical protein [Pectobacterium]MBA5238052.1 hypothetical protein [Pectobacterium aroidearum]UUE44776.1 hypothetical protein L0Y28_20090 [Pectobacterium aroidearum]UUE48995.1 hypothetical protein L0Y23_19970 [Pectobacterium aroidearum]UUE53199.1 hypothetical protein L0Y30_20090 [Pectobacterium aroidearum]UUE57980.1 hypothetical protein L0Y27_01370 [Pectobacterium aroidearum]
MDKVRINSYNIGEGMGFKDAKKQLIVCLQSGTVLHEARGNISTKNLLATGQTSITELIDIIYQSSGTSYSSSPHHFAAHIDVHIIRCRHRGISWYIKWYFAEPNCVFISVHH